MDDNSYSILDTTAKDVTSYTANNLLCNKSYLFRIKGLGTALLSGYSNVVSVETLQLTPPVLTTPASTSACDGNTIQLTAPGGFTEYLWNTGETTQSISAVFSGDHTVQVKDQNGCLSFSSQPVALTFFNYPDTALTISDSNITVPANSNHYQWYLNNAPMPGAIENSITIKKTGIYKVEISNQECSIFSREVPFIIAGVEDDKPSGVTVYPVPASETVTISFEGSGAISEKSVVLMDSGGKIINTIGKHPGTKSLLINTSNLRSGIYVLHIISNRHVEYRKIVIVHEER